MIGFTKIFSYEQTDRSKKEHGNQGFMVPYLSNIEYSIVGGKYLMNSQKYSYHKKDKSQNFR